MCRARISPPAASGRGRRSHRRGLRTGRGGFRLRARWARREGPHGTWVYQIVVTEIPYQVQKSRLIEQIAELLEREEAAAAGDVRDESAEDIRLVLEPRPRTSSRKC
jgi:topoisomerase-4 subunit A